MKTVNLTQGTPEWHLHRANHFNASDAPAMMGVSKYKTRNQFLTELKTGVVPDVNEFTQKIFDDGHAFEAKARLLAEQIIGEDLYPVTGTQGQFSASFDGLTMDESINFEHKTLNDEIRSANTAAELHPMYRIQMEHQMMVSKSEKTLFMASKWKGDELVEEKHFWYEPDLELRESVVAGWLQLEKDLKDFEPGEYKQVKADSMMQLPALSVQIKGEIVATNLPAFKEAAQLFIESINTDLKTDEDFANAEATVKFCDKAEKELETAKKAALSQTASIDELLRTIDFIKENMRDKRLMLDKLVKTKKESIKAQIIQDANKKFLDYVAELNQTLEGVRLTHFAPDFVGAMKSKKTLASIHDAVDTALASAKIELTHQAQDIQINLGWLNATEASSYMFLFNDLQQIIHKPKEDFILLIESRINEHKAIEEKRLEAERERIRTEEQKKAEAAAKPVEAPTIGSTTTKFSATPAAFTKAPAKTKPTDMQIAETLASHFGVQESVVFGWLLEMDLDQLGEQLHKEFQ